MVTGVWGGVVMGIWVEVEVEEIGATWIVIVSTVVEVGGEVEAGFW